MSASLNKYFLPMHACRPWGIRNWISPGFEKGLEYIASHPELQNDRNSLSVHSGKFVWKMHLPEDVGGQTVAYKLCGGKKPLRYLFSPSLPVRELRNYQFLHGLQIPAPQVLAIGEERIMGILRKSFIVTEFIENSHDGTCFMPGGRCREDRNLRNQFLQQVLPLLARLHRHNFFHKAFHLRNLLWRQSSCGAVEVFFIDVARCRMYPKALMPSAIVFDLRTLFRDLRLPEEENIRILKDYLEYNPDCVFSLQDLIYELQHFRRRLAGDPVNVLNYQ